VPYGTELKCQHYSVLFFLRSIGVLFLHNLKPSYLSLTHRPQEPPTEKHYSLRDRILCRTLRKENIQLYRGRSRYPVHLHRTYKLLVARPFTLPTSSPPRFSFALLWHVIQEPLYAYQSSFFLLCPSCVATCNFIDQDC
jgi:hypothetical protein